MSDERFDNIVGFNFTPTIAKGFLQDGIEEPTDVQWQALPAILAGQNTVLRSGTGTGKTLAYLLPVMQRLLSPAQGRAVVMTPATELAVQIARVAGAYKEESLNLGTATSSANHGRQKARVTKSTKLIIGTPGRILELYAARKMKNVTTIILDEPDPILNSEHGDYLREILSRPDPKVQLIMVAATFGPNSERLIKERMGEHHANIEAHDSPLHTHIHHHFIKPAGKMGKEVCLARFIEENKCQRAIVFLNQPEVISHLYRYLNEHKLNTVTLSKERSKLQCQQAIEQMARGDARILLTTDAAARGLDFPELPWVFHYDLPSSPEAYVHRSGRTGRAGKTGTSVAIISDKSRVHLKRFAKILDIECTPFQRQR